jgi:hypothetical protein
MKRRFGLYLALGTALVLGTASSAHAQGTVIEAAPQTISAGQVMTVTGGGFTTAVGANPVQIRLSTRDGRVLLDGPDVTSRGQLDNASFPFPNDIPPGTYLLLATQTYSTGLQVAFTPGRTRIRVVAAGANAGVPTGGNGSPLGPLPLGAVIAAIVLLGAGSALTVRRLRVHTRPGLGA